MSCHQWHRYVRQVFPRQFSQFVVTKRQFIHSFITTMREEYNFLLLNGRWIRSICLSMVCIIRFEWIWKNNFDFCIEFPRNAIWFIWLQQIAADAFVCFGSYCCLCELRINDVEQFLLGELEDCRRLASVYSDTIVFVAEERREQAPYEKWIKFPFAEPFARAAACMYIDERQFSE